MDSRRHREQQSMEGEGLLRLDLLVEADVELQLEEELGDGEALGLGRSVWEAGRWAAWVCSWSRRVESVGGAM